MHGDESVAEQRKRPVVVDRVSGEDDEIRMERGHAICELAERTRLRDDVEIAELHDADPFSARELGGRELEVRLREPVWLDQRAVEDAGDRDRCGSDERRESALLLRA